MYKTIEEEEEFEGVIPENELIEKMMLDGKAVHTEGQAIRFVKYYGKRGMEYLPRRFNYLYEGFNNEQKKD